MEERMPDNSFWLGMALYGMLVSLGTSALVEHHWVAFTISLTGIAFTVAGMRWNVQATYAKGQILGLEWAKGAVKESIDANRATLR
jgi:hypothetical protein